MLDRRAGPDRREAPREPAGRRSSDMVTRRCMACGKTICQMSIRDALKPGEILKIICTCNQQNLLVGTT